MDNTGTRARADDSEASFREGIRRIRNIQFNYDDCTALFQRGVKMQGPVINALGALWQRNAEESSDGADWCVFSSWLGDIVSLKSPAVIGSLEDHVKVVTSNESTEVLLACPRWFIPLRGGTPSHWVLGWIDYGSSTMGIFDSIPELASSFWAEPLLLKVVDDIRRCIKAPLITWDNGSWSRQLAAPPTRERQLDGWSCGLFVLMAMKALAERRGWDSVADSKKDEMRALAIQELLTIAIWKPINKLDEVGDGDSDGVVEVKDGRYEKRKGKDTTSGGKMMVVDKNALPIDFDPEVSLAAPIASSSKEKKNLIKIPGFQSSKRKHDDEDLDDDGYNTVDSDSSKRARKSMVSGIPRTSKKSDSSRKKSFEEDEWIRSVEAKRVRCKGCNSWVKLREDRNFDPANWIKHLRKCKQITGVEFKRISVPKPKNLEAPSGVRSLTTFFQPGPPALRLGKKEPVSPSSKPFPEPGAHYITRNVHVPKSIALIFEPGPIKKSKPPPPPVFRQCHHLTGKKYEEYILRSQTRSFGGVSFKLRARLSRQLYPYKSFPVLKTSVSDDVRGSPTGAASEFTAAAQSSVIPEGGNAFVKFSLWTDSEKSKLEEALRAWSRWEVNYIHGYVCATRCEGTTTNHDQICTTCQKVADDPSLKAALRKKEAEAALPADEQRNIVEQQTKYAPRSFTSLEAHALKEKLNDPLIFQVHQLLERGQHTECFLTLHHLSRSGQLKNLEVFTDLCKVLADKVNRDNSGNPKAKYGIRYTQNYLNFMVLLRSHGHNSAKQYGMLAGQLPAPSSRHLRTLTAKSVDALQNPALIYENVARVKRLVDSIKYTGPIAIAGDCTKVRARLTYSNDFGSHVLGSTLPLDKCEVDSSDDIDEIIERIASQGVLATQVRAILVKVPLPHVPPVVIALIATSGKDDAQQIHTQHMNALGMAANLLLPVVSFAADGAASEMAAQTLMDREVTDLPPVTFDHPLYGMHLKAPVFRHTGPVVSISDAPHGRKTCRNQPQHGTHTASLGVGHLVNRSLVQLYECKASGLVKRDVEDVDKQDDGAARRVFHQTALWAATEVDEKGEHTIKEGLHGLFVYLFVFGTLFDAWLSRSMSMEDRILAAFRARYFLHMWRLHILKLSKKYPDLYSTARSFISPASFHIFNRLCDSLVLLAIIYTRYYPTQLFCPWLLGTEFVEHFFGLARMLLPNFTYGEFLKMVKHIMLRQRLLLSGKFKEKRERDSVCGYIMDYDGTPILAKETRLSVTTITDHAMSELVAVGFNEASHLCKDILHISVIQPTGSAPIILVPVGAHLRKPKAKKPREKSNNGDSSEPETDSDVEDESEDESDMETLETPTISECTALASKDAARYSALCEEHDALLDKAEIASAAGHLAGGFIGPAIVPHTSAPLPLTQTPLAFTSKILDGNGKASIHRILKYRDTLQSGTTARSEQVVKLNPKFIIDGNAELDNPEDAKKLSVKEASHRVRIAQATLPTLAKKQPKKDRELRWKATAAAIRSTLTPQELPNLSTKNVNAIFQVTLSSFLIMRNDSRMYIGKVFDMYKTGSSGRYGSVTSSTNLAELQAVSILAYLPLLTGTPSEDSESDEDGISNTVAPLFSCKQGSTQANLHTYAPIKDVLYHLGSTALIPLSMPSEQKSGTIMSLSSDAALHWTTLSRKEVAKVLPKLTIRIPVARIAAK